MVGWWKKDQNQFERSTWNAVRVLSEVLLKNENGGPTREQLEAHLGSIFPHCSGSLFHYNRKKNKMEEIAAIGAVDAVHKKTFHPDTCHAVQQGKFRYSEAGQDACVHLSDEHEQSSFCQPILVEGETAGLLTLKNIPLNLNENAEESLQFRTRVEITVNLLGLYLTYVEMKLRVKVHSIRDPLTGLYNRHHMEESVRRELISARRRGVSVGIIMLQLDTLMQVQDQYGAKAAEQLLWEVGTALPRYIREEDIPCRFSKMVFAVVMPTASLDITARRAEKIRQEVDDLQVGFRDGMLHTTLSLGVAVANPDDGMEVQEILEKAEKSLYKAIYDGGNVVSLGA
jgi:diguanylate cyclase (GGDEF)-like protein